VERAFKKGVKHGEIKAIRSQIARLKKVERDMAPRHYLYLMTPLEARLTRLKGK